MNTVKKIVSHLAKEEGKKHQASVGDVREIVSLLSDLFIKNPEAMITLCENGRWRSRVKRKK